MRLGAQPQHTCTRVHTCYHPPITIATLSCMSATYNRCCLHMTEMLQNFYLYITRLAGILGAHYVNPHHPSQIVNKQEAIIPLKKD